MEKSRKKIMFASPWQSVKVIKLYSDALTTMITGLEARTREIVSRLCEYKITARGDRITKEIRDSIARDLRKDPKTIYASLEEMYEENYLSKTKEGKTNIYILQYDVPEILSMLQPIAVQLNLDNDLVRRMFEEGIGTLGRKALTRADGLDSLNKQSRREIFSAWASEILEKVPESPGKDMFDGCCIGIAEFFTQVSSDPAIAESTGPVASTVETGARLKETSSLPNDFLRQELIARVIQTGQGIYVVCSVCSLNPRLPYVGYFCLEGGEWNRHVQTFHGLASSDKTPLS